MSGGGGGNLSSLSGFCRFSTFKSKKICYNSDIGHHEFNGGFMKKAFTLAEILITLGIIGVVAVIVLPSLMTNINDRVNAEKIRSTKYKFTKATDHMKSLGLIGPYSSTDAFVDELQKYFKIAKRCDANHLRACWPTDTVKLEDGKEWDIAKTKTGKQLKMKDDDTHDYSSDNVGIITADGTPMILSYNKKCESLDPMKTYGWSTSNGKPESNATAGCVAAVFEINGNGRPNTFRKDVVAFNANGLGSACALEINGRCFGAPFSPTPMTKAECQAAVAEGKLGIKTCASNSDYWAGAVKQCNGIQNMPTDSDLAKIASLLYEGNPTIGATSNVEHLHYNGKASHYGFPETYFYFVSGEETDGCNAYGRLIDSWETGWVNGWRTNTNKIGLCVVE